MSIFLNKNRLRSLLSDPGSVKIGILGDFCVDVYWDIAPEPPEISIETGLPVTAVMHARYSPGGAGNIAANLQGIGYAHPLCTGVTGTDPFGLWLQQHFRENLFVAVDRPDYHTPVYCKPLRNGVEQPRIDLGNDPITNDEAEQLLERVKETAKRVDVLIINEQLLHGIHTPYFRNIFARYVKENPENIRFLYDGRNFPDAYPGSILKINREAASRMTFGSNRHPARECGKAMIKNNPVPFIITDGENGCYLFENGQETHIPAVLYDGPVDTVGAGDSFTAGFAFALAKKASLTEAAGFGTLCSGITVRKLNQTGIPAPDELLSL